MDNPFEELAGLNRLIHEPARLAIMTALSACKKADFVFLQNLTGLTKGNLSTHLTRLEEAQLIEVDKQFAGKKPVTLIQLSDRGHQAIQQYWARLEQLRDAAALWEGGENA